MTDLPAFADFAALHGERFAVAAADAETEMTLVTAQARSTGAVADQPREPFELEFRGPPAAIWPQGIYRFGHPALGEVDIFVVPIASDADGVTYHASFN